MDSPTNEPRPRSNVIKIEEKRDWQATSILKDVRLKFNSEIGFDEVFEGRRTRRVISDVSLRETRAFIKHVFSPRQLGKGALKGRVRKTMISAGALHPIEIIIVSGPQVYDPIIFSDKHKKFLTIPILDPGGFKSAIENAKNVQPLSSGHLMLFVGDRKRVESAYHNSASLLWRDSGAAAQACSSSAYAYGYGYCPLGINGDDILASIGPPRSSFMALGMGLFGR